jgi:hypothetical protein
MRWSADHQSLERYYALSTIRFDLGKVITPDGVSDRRSRITLARGPIGIVEPRFGRRPYDSLGILLLG